MADALILDMHDTYYGLCSLDTTRQSQNGELLMKTICSSTATAKVNSLHNVNSFLFSLKMYKITDSVLLVVSGYLKVNPENLQFVHEHNKVHGLQEKS